ncbi:MAG: glutathionylspermidine synthase family protein [Deltaproteobacteria bacterium]|nr:glutathionylspermidine synthase family protein [Deltaproteobacteria bacterium]
MTVDGAFLQHASRLKASGFVLDPWFDGTPRFRAEPLVLTAVQWQQLQQAAEQVASCYEAVAQLCLQDPALLDELSLTPFQKLMWASSAPLWHGIARADAFFTPQGISICEINSDTPTGEPEAVVTSALATELRPSCLDPNAGLRERFLWMVGAMHGALPSQSPLQSVGIVYPTELTEDLGMIALYHRWLVDAGYKVTLGSPFNLQERGPTGVMLWDTPCDVVVRHYKTDWWGERESVWKDEDEYPDTAPIDGPLGILVRAAIDGRVAVVNPFGSVVTQNKRAMALMWEHQDRLPAWAQQAVQSYVPRTARLETMPRAQLEGERAQWVLKSDYGCEGDQVILGRGCTDEEWKDTLDKAVPGRWVAQRWFDALCDEAGAVVNYGVYLVAGQACGLLCRSQAGATDPAAVVIPALVEGA